MLSLESRSLNHETFHLAFLLGVSWWVAGGLWLGTPHSKPPISTNIKMYACLFSLIFNNNLQISCFLNNTSRQLPKPLSLRLRTLWLWSSMLFYVLSYWSSAAIICRSLCIETSDNLVAEIVNCPNFTWSPTSRSTKIWRRKQAPELCLLWR